MPPAPGIAGGSTSAISGLLVDVVLVVSIVGAWAPAIARVPVATHHRRKCAAQRNPTVRVRNGETDEQECQYRACPGSSVTL